MGKGGKGGNLAGGVIPLQLLRQGRRLGQDQNLGFSLGQFGKAVDPFGAARILEVEFQRRAIDDLGGHGGRFAHLAQPAFDDDRKIGADKAVADEKHLCEKPENVHLTT